LCVKSGTRCYALSFCKLRQYVAARICGLSSTLGRDSIQEGCASLSHCERVDGHLTRFVKRRVFRKASHSIVALSLGTKHARGMDSGDGASAWRVGDCTHDAACDDWLALLVQMFKCAAAKQTYPTTSTLPCTSRTDVCASGWPSPFDQHHVTRKSSAPG
jgi:hypothetical protein